MASNTTLYASLVGLSVLGFWYASKRTRDNGGTPTATYDGHNHGFRYSDDCTVIELVSEHLLDEAATKMATRNGWTGNPPSSKSELRARFLEFFWEAVPRCRGTAPIKIGQGPQSMDFDAYVDLVWSSGVGFEGSSGMWAPEGWAE